MKQIKQRSCRYLKTRQEIIITYENEEGYECEYCIDLRSNTSALEWSSHLLETKCWCTHQIIKDFYRCLEAIKQIHPELSIFTTVPPLRLLKAVSFYSGQWLNIRDYPEWQKALEAQ